MTLKPFTGGALATLVLIYVYIYINMIGGVREICLIKSDRERD